MAGFEDAWRSATKSIDGEAVSAADLRPLLRQVYFDVLAKPSNLHALKLSLSSLLEYLSIRGRPNANCWAVDLFFCLSEGWEQDWTEQNLPDEFHDVLSLMGQALHDTVKNPKIAENFDCLPEQLLTRVQSIRLHY
jgi:hypothetical protein